MFCVSAAMGLVAACTPISGAGPGSADAGSADAGSTDAGSTDAGSTDAGSPDSQQSYTYPGCEDAGSDGCPHLGVFACALNAIREKYLACQSAADCVAVSATNCVEAFTICPPAAVSDAGAAAFLAEANLEGARYCDGGRCGSGGLCGLSFRGRQVDCLGGRCVAVPDDAGP